MMQGPNPPRNCNCAYSREGDQIFTNRNYTAEQTRSRFLSGDVEDEIRCVCVSIVCEEIRSETNLSLATFLILFSITVQHFF